ncbi:MAG TPA: zinc-binding dehydrogenase [Anaerolineaceae bacterium]|nr:zinc-binding dehydrogenase [Anaerolineaceae bacterium]
MGQVVVFQQPRVVTIEHEPEKALGPKDVRLRTLYSGISAGTEMSAYRGTNPAILKQWDLSRRLFVPSESPSQSYPLAGWGYEEVGQVVEAGSEVQAVRPGDFIYGIWGHRTEQVVTEEYAAKRLLPAGLDPVLGIFSHIGPIAINGVHDAAIRIGETVAVFGLGVLGQAVAQLAKKSGARVVGVDTIARRLQMGLDTGALDAAFHPAEGSPAEQIKALTGGLGADVSIEVSGSTRALQEAIRSTAYSSRVVALGFFQGEAHGLYLGEEFHHNRVSIISSQISGSAAELSYRWNRERLIQTTMRLQVEGLLNLRPLITHVVPFEQAAEAFRLLDEHPADALQVVLSFEPAAR